MAASETKVIELETKLNEMMKKLERIEEFLTKYRSVRVSRYKRLR